MRINLSPQVRDDTLDVTKAGNTLTINGETIDLSPMTEGGTLPLGAISSSWFASDVDMVDGEIILTLFLPNSVHSSHEQLFPVPLLNVPDGPVAFPQSLPAPQAMEESQ
ncbi:hypothetical protein [Pseudomonas brassicacearum]|uniref:hypothetical protein n=1 Tax=Pseudomonas brassicacearum TaxID=930166 RepID=UPI0005B3CE98|nr:hypothetical protein [Pseudomonas brassicacearum]